MKKDITIYNFNNSIYKGNIEIDFFIYCVKKKFILIKYFFIYFWFLFLYRLKIKTNKDLYGIKKNFFYLFNENDFIDFKNRHMKKIKYWYYEKKKDTDILISSSPINLIKHFADELKINEYVGDDLSSDVDINKLEKIKEKFKKVDTYYGNNDDIEIFKWVKNAYYISGNKIKEYNNDKKIFNKHIFYIILLLIVLSFIILGSTFLFTTPIFSIKRFIKYFLEIKLILLNFMPIFLILSLLYIWFNRIWLSFSISSIIFLVPSVVNKLKLINRDDPFVFADIFVFKEAAEISEKIGLVLPLYTYFIVLGLIIVSFILFTLIKVSKIRFLNKCIYTILIIFTVLIGYNFIYINDNLYKKVGNTSGINIYSASQQFQIKGFIYPFIYSTKEMKVSKPVGYSESIAKDLLNDYIHEDIPDDKKVNIIAIMLESHNDFTKFDIEINSDIYKDMHDIKEESYYGNLFTSIFGGSTVDTERKFLTGYSNINLKFRQKTNSYMWYFKEQGYNVDAVHPIFGWFYNRRNVNLNLGFDNYYYYENRFKEIYNSFIEDSDFFKEIINDYENNKDKPYFSFSITYQNHMPYSTAKEIDEEHIVKKDSYDVSTYNNINNYLEGIRKTNAAMKEIVEYFSNVDDPTIIIFFGDHNPFLGQDNKGYNMIGIDFDRSTIKGLQDYYETFYMFWGNDGTKRMFNKSFKGTGDTISPEFLMNELFDYIGLKGNQYMQYMSNVKKDISVINHSVYKENDVFTTSLSKEGKEILNNLRYVQYYEMNNFRGK